MESASLRPDTYMDVSTCSYPVYIPAQLLNVSGYITVARRDKNSDDWYIGAITDENAREAHIDLSFLPKGRKYTATIYEDAPDADWKTNPQAYRIRTATVSSKTRLRQPLAPGGGTAIRLTPTPKK